MPKFLKPPTLAKSPLLAKAPTLAKPKTLSKAPVMDFNMAMHAKATGKSFRDIAGATGKSKSTHHREMSDLIKNGFIKHS